MAERLGAGQSEAPKSLETESRKKPVILIMGAEGSGKSTQAYLLAQRYNLPTIVMGEEFRELAENDTTELGAECKRMLDAGQYSSDELFERVFDSRFSKEDVKRGVVVDGVFRTTGQVESTKELIQRYIGDADITVVFLRSPIWEGASRAMQRSGTYDTEERILSRQGFFFKDLGRRVSLIKNYFRFIQITTFNKSVEKVQEEIIRKYEEVAIN